MQRTLYTILLLVLPLVARAAPTAGRPDTVSILSKNPAFVYLHKMENLTDGSIRYRIKLCLGDGNGCDLVAYSRDLTALADYAYLYLIHDKEADVQNRPSAADVIKEARDKKWDQGLLDAYAPGVHCVRDKDEADCVMKGLIKSAGIVRYWSNLDEDQDIYTLMTH